MILPILAEQAITQSFKSFKSLNYWQSFYAFPFRDQTYNLRVSQQTLNLEIKGLSPVNKSSMSSCYQEIWWLYASKGKGMVLCYPSYIALYTNCIGQEIVHALRTRIQTLCYTVAELLMFILMNLWTYLRWCPGQCRPWDAFFFFFF